MRVLHVQYTNPGAYPPLVRGAQLLAESGAEVLMLGTRVRDTDPLTVPPTRGVAVRLAEQAEEGWRLKAHYGRYAAWVAREAAQWKPDWIYASDLFATPIALGLAALTRARVVYHEHDAPAHEHPNWIIKRYLDARQRLLRQADLVVTPNAERSAHLSAGSGGREVMTVWNCPRRPAHRPDMAKADDVLRVIFRGSVNADRLPLTIVEALARVEAPVTLDVAGYETAGSRGYLGSLAARAAELGIAERVRILGTVPDNELGVICEQCDLGLALMPMESPDENMRHMTGASNKVFEYLSYGIAPLVSALPDWRRTFVDPGYAFDCQPAEPDSVAESFRWAAAHRRKLREAAERGWERLRRDWNYESQFAPVLDAMWGRSTVTKASEPLRAREGAECAS